MSSNETVAVNSNDPEIIKAQIEHTREQLSDDVNALADGVNPKNVVKRKTQKITGAVGGVKDRVMGKASDTQDAAGGAVHAVGDAASAAPTQVVNRTQGNPLAAGLIAFGAGLLVAGLIPATKAERQVAAGVKDKTEPLVEEVKQVAKDTAQDLKAPAQEAVQSVKDTATDAAATLKDEGQSAAGSVRDDAQQAKDTVQESRSA